MIRKLLRLFRKRIKVGLYVTEKTTTCTNCDGIQSVIGTSKYGPLKSPLNYEQTKQVYKG